MLITYDENSKSVKVGFNFYHLIFMWFTYIWFILHSVVFYLSSIEYQIFWQFLFTYADQVHFVTGTWLRLLSIFRMLSIAVARKLVLMLIFIQFFLILTMVICLDLFILHYNDDFAAILDNPPAYRYTTTRVIWHFAWHNF